MQERRWLLGAALLVAFGLWLTWRAQTRSFTEVNVLLASGEIVDLGALENPEALMPALEGVYPDETDRRVVADHLYASLLRHRPSGPYADPLPNVGALNTRAWDLPEHLAKQGGSGLKKRLEQRRFRPGVLRGDSQGEHRIPVFESAEQFRRFKDHVIVRTPHDYTYRYWLLALLFFGAMASIHLFWFSRRFPGDPILLPTFLLLTGLGLMLMFGLPDPLRDQFLARDYVVGVLAGSCMMVAVSQLDFQASWWRKRTFFWLGTGIGLALLLYVFGSGPLGSDARVNLVLPVVGSVQPAEVIKLCFVLFLAGYFARHWELLRNLRQRAGLPRPLQRLDVPRLRHVLPVSLAVMTALLLFLALRDMGPALVLACTFLVLYGIVRHRWPAVLAGMATLTSVFAFTYLTRAIPVVADRIEMLMSPWENFVRGGEHLAHAYWAMATGGLTGQGPGQGHPGFIPAAHTDMVLPALGETLGLLGLLAVLALYLVLLHRALRIALQACGAYSLFLGLGVTLLLLFQILFIAGGTLGLLPLSGVVTPFLSYGKSSMVVHGILLGMLMSLSARPGTPAQQTAYRTLFRRPVRYVAAMALVAFAVLAGRAAYIQVLHADDLALRPALVPRQDGTRAYVYNPRILAARKTLTRGSIYDRNGVPLATSRWREIEAFRTTYERLGRSIDRLNRTDTRFYPFGPLTFYLLGDIRSRVKWGATNSLYAEHTFLSHLRGYDNHPRPIVRPATRAGDLTTLVRYDYSELASLVRYGTASPEARRLLRRPRDLHLTLDVRLQQRVAEILAERVPEGKVASAVVLDAATGDVLASVTHPLPDLSRPAIVHRDPDAFDRGYGQGAKPPGSTFKVVTAIAALRRTPATRTWTHEVHARDRYARRHEPTGRVDLRRALVASSNVYFAALAREVAGPDSLQAVMERLGFRVGGPHLSRRAQRALLREPDNLRQAGFGQGPVVGSPLAVARIAAVLANDGVLPEVRWIHSGTPRTEHRLLAPEDARLLARFLRGVVTDREGTAHRLRDLSVPVAGKTGTAEEKHLLVREGQPVRVTQNHAWFTGFAPYAEVPGGPRIAVAVLVEEGGSGGVVAAPIAGAIVEAAADLGLIPRDAASPSRGY